MKYKVKVIETLEKIVEIEAANTQEAHDKAENMWDNNEIEWDIYANHDSHEIEVINN